MTLPLLQRPGFALLSLAATLLALPLSQAQSAPKEETFELDDLVVTGSNIGGIEVQKNLPITVVSAADVEAQGIGSMAELISSIPFSTNVEIDETATGPNDARGDVSTINLRNLGAGRTLVLLNGRRLSAYGVTPGTPPVQFVNINSIPVGAIGQVEILRDGASAIYGSDAIGGVVNMILNKDYDSTEISMRYAGGNDGPKEFNVSFSGGTSFNEGKTKVALFLDYYDREQLDAKNRVFAADADNTPLAPVDYTPGTNWNRRSSSGPYGRFTAIDDAGNSVAVSGVAGSNGRFYYDPETGDRASGTGPSSWYNSNEGNILLPSIERYSLFSTIDHRLTDLISVFGELSYYDSHSYGAFGAIPISSGTDGVVVSKDNYYNPVGTRFYGPGTANPTGTPRDVLIRNYRVTELGPRSYDTDADSYRAVAGLRGFIPDSSWSWETGLLYMRGKTKQVNHGYISQSLFEQQLALSTPDAYNPFGEPGSNPEEAWKPFTIDIWDEGVGTLSSIDAKAKGEVFSLPGGPVEVAFGGEYRSESMEQRNDPYGLADDVIAQSEQLDVDADREVLAGFTEVLVPIVGKANRMPGIYEVQLRGAARFEHYSRFDSTKPGVGLSYRPVEWFLLRGSYNEGFRAPTVVELYTPAIGRRNEGIVDPLRPGEPDAVSSVSKRVLTGGNPDLKPEESKSYTYGIVLEVPGLQGLSLGVDFYHIEEKNQIDNSDPDDELTLDAELWDANQGGNPRVIREAQTADDIAKGIPGAIIEILSTYQNRTLREIEGYDFFLQYRSPKTSIGQFDFSGTLTYIDYLMTIDEDGNESQLVRNNGTPQIKASANLTWTYEQVSISVSERYTGEFDPSAAYQPWVIDEFWVTNVSLGYRFDEGPLAGLRVRVGANNLFDKDPPVYPGSSAGYQSSYHDPRGQMLYVQTTYKF